MNQGRVIAVVPARLQSTRLPRKLLLSETGKPLIQHTWEAASSCRFLDDVIVATDSHEIAEAVIRFGGKVELTGEHPSGTDRIAEVVRRCCPNAEVIVNLQGDEPEIRVDDVRKLVDALLSSQCQMATLATPLKNADAIRDPSCVKVVVNDQSQAMYFSRHPIPFTRDRSIEELIARGEFPWRLHLGIYAFRTPFLLQLTEMPPAQLELLERLEQLRALQSGAAIAVADVEAAAIGIDTPEDYAAFVMRNQ